jgi:hypothetical protein
MRRILALASLFGALAACTLSTQGNAPDATHGGPGGAPGSTSSTTSTSAGPTTTTGATGGGGSTSATTTSTGATTTSTTSGGGGDACGGGSTCLPPLPAGAVYLNVVGKDDVCAAGSATHDVTQCGVCECTPSGGTCSISVTAWGGDGCNSQYVDDKTNGCLDVNKSFSRSAKATATYDGNASCAAVQSEVPTKATKACEAAPVASCPNAGDVCVPQQGKTCALVPGMDASACPAGYSTSVTTVFDGAAAKCACDCAVASANCAGATAGWTNNKGDCSGPLQSFAADGACHDLGNADSVSAAQQPATATCSPTAAPSPPAPQYVLCCP